MMVKREADGSIRGADWLRGIVIPIIVAGAIAIAGSYVTGVVSMAKLEERLAAMDRSLVEVKSALERTRADQYDRLSGKDWDRLSAVFEARLQATASRVETLERFCQTTHGRRTEGPIDTRDSRADLLGDRAHP